MDGVHGTLQARILECVAFPKPGIEPRSPALQADSLPAEPQGKPKNTRVGSLPSPADFPDPGIEMGSPALQADSLPADPIDGSAPGSCVPGILQARTLEWVAITFSKQSYERMNKAVQSNLNAPCLTVNRSLWELDPLLISKNCFRKGTFLEQRFLTFFFFFPPGRVYDYTCVKCRLPW